MRKNIPFALILVLAVILSACSAGQASPSPVPGESTAPAAPGTSASPDVSPEPTATPTATPEITPEPTPEPTPTPEPESIKVKAVYLSGHVAGAKLDHFIELVNETELNALVIDIKEAGYVNYLSEIPMVKELGLCKKIYDVEEVLRKCHENNIYVIGRIVCFRDDGLSKAKPEYGIKTPGGKLWTEGSYGSWTNPSIEAVQDFNIEIAKEAVALGFDEIQFDYVRFPTTGKGAVVYDENMPEKTEVIAGFVKKAAEEIKKVKDVPISADVFGIVIESDTDAKAIGQDLAKIGQYIDYISPMIYPSHYANSSKGMFGNGVGQKINGKLFTHPDLYPYDVIYNALIKLKDKAATTYEGFTAKVRPYLQDFTIKMAEGYYQEYGVEQVRDQIKAVYDAGYEEWILWDGKNTYTEDALLKE